MKIITYKNTFSKIENNVIPTRHNTPEKVIVNFMNNAKVAIIS